MQDGDVLSRIRNYVLRRDVLAVAIILLLTCLVTHPNLRNPDIDDLDSAHHLMDGYFFRDLIVDQPQSHLSSYVLNYYKQYPALGFIFWPPLVPAVLGVFCFFGGPHVLVARVCMFCFGLLFSLAFYALLRRRFSTWLSVAGVVAVITVPGMAWSFNQVMLELPTLAVMCLAVLAYFRLVDSLHEPSSYVRALLCALACAAVVYSKQPAWFLYCAIAFDFLVCHARHLRKREVWLAVIATLVFCVPLALFTIKFGHADLVQSVGNDTQLIMRQYQSLPRWSLAAWSFYPRLAPSLLNPILVIAVLGALALTVLRRGFLRSHALWLGWFCFAYLTFSYYDNRLPRHATFWWPAWIALAVACIDVVMKSMPQRLTPALLILLLFPVPFQLRAAWRTDFTDYRLVQKPITDLFVRGEPGNILVFGADKQVLTALIREHDISRAVHVIRGERLLDGTQSLGSVCRRYRIGTVLVELPTEKALNEEENLRDLASMQVVLKSQFLRRGTPVTLLAYRYVGPIDSRMAEIPLSKGLIE
jgi:hypothetical protein